MPECLMVDSELLKDINSRRLDNKRRIHGKERPSYKDIT
jgi:hypothetical protein